MTVGADQLPSARDVADLATHTWAGRKPTMLIGRDERFATVLERTRRFANSDAPVLITGETGTGKELLARALFLLSPRRHRQFLAVNCAQYHDGNSRPANVRPRARQLHRRGGDHRGVFEGGEWRCRLSRQNRRALAAPQACSARAQRRGDRPVGNTRARWTSASSRRRVRSEPVVASGAFRPDLYTASTTCGSPFPRCARRGADWAIARTISLRALPARRHDERLSDDARM